MNSTGKVSVDVMIPVAPKDYIKLPICIESLKHSLTEISNIYLVALDEKPLEYVPNDFKTKTKIILESQYPFTKNDIATLLEKKGSKHGHASWYYQQFLKMYVHEVIENINENVVIFDSDFALKNPIEFLDKEGKPVLSCGYPFKWLLNTLDYPEVNHVHAEFAKRFIPGWEVTSPFSGMHHHQVFPRKVLKELFELVESRDRLPFWNAVIHHLDVKKWNAFSEYLLMYHWMVKNYSTEIVSRHIDASDIIYDSQENQGLI